MGSCSRILEGSLPEEDQCISSTPTLSLDDTHTFGIGLQETTDGKILSIELLLLLFQSFKSSEALNSATEYANRRSSHRHHLYNVHLEFDGNAGRCTVGPSGSRTHQPTIRRGFRAPVPIAATWDGGYSVNPSIKLDISLTANEDSY